MRDGVESGKTCKMCGFQCHDAKVSREDMWVEMNHTCGINSENTPKLEESVIAATDPCEACDGAHALLIKTCDCEKICNGMAKPAFIFDGRNLLDHDKLRKIGFEVHAIGKPDPLTFSDL